MADLRDLGPGDEVAIVRHMTVPQIARIQRVTATQIVLANGSRWRRKDGDRVGDRDPWYRTRIEPATDAHRYAVERESLMGQIEHTWRRHDVVRRLSLDTLRAISAALQADPAVRRG